MSWTMLRHSGLDLKGLDKVAEEEAVFTAAGVELPAYVVGGLYVPEKLLLSLSLSYS